VGGVGLGRPLRGESVEARTGFARAAKLESGKGDWLKPVPKGGVGVGTGRFAPRTYSHSIVAGGFEERSSATRFTPRTSLMIRELIVSSSS